MKLLYNNIEYLCALDQAPSTSRTLITYYYKPYTHLHHAISISQQSQILYLNSSPLVCACRSPCYILYSSNFSLYFLYLKLFTTQSGF